MHYTAEQNARRFFSTYITTELRDVKILEIGSQIGGFNIRSLSPSNATYVGVDLEQAPGVDVVLKDQYIFPFENDSFDFIVSSSCFEHIEFFWMSFLEIIRVLKPHGLFYMNAPSNGDFHRYPIDCWRFFPDSGLALANWGKYNKYNCEVIEQYTSNNENDIWSDYVSVFIKDISNINLYSSRIINNFHNYTNGSVYPNNNILNKKMWK
jgi:SAM-dependent methyltransferase